MGWEMLDYLAKKVSEALNKKSITPEDELDASGYIMVLEERLVKL